MYPTLETIKQLAQTKEYRRIPLCRELYADRYTPVEVMRILRKASRHCYLLESASQTEVWGRYSFLGYEPSMEITCTDGILKIRKTDVQGKKEEITKQVTHPGDTLRENERIAQIAKDAEGFVYCVSSLGVTGTRTNITTDIGAMVKLVKQAKDIPCAVGFGISTPEQAKKMAAQSDGAIVGSAIVKLCAQYGRDCVPYVKEYVKSMKDAVMEA